MVAIESLATTVPEQELLEVCVDFETVQIQFYLSLSRELSRFLCHFQGLYFSNYDIKYAIM